MIIARSPLRISLGGGGTDVPSYFQKHGGYVLSAAINKYVYITVTRPFDTGIFLKYSNIEKVKNVNDVQHPIIRETLRTLNLKSPQIEVTSLADIPAGSGLGSSGSFTTCLIKALYTHYRKPIYPKDLAELACEIEIDKLKEPIGKQDQYISAYGGITEFTFGSNGHVEVNSLKLSPETIHCLEDNLLLFFTGQLRRASSILRDQVERSTLGEDEITENLHMIKALGYEVRDALLAGDADSFGRIMNQHWRIKRSRSENISNSIIDIAYEKALAAGALGGKLIGAGGGGFLMFYTKRREELKNAMKELGIEEVRFRFDFEGTKVLSI